MKKILLLSMIICGVSVTHAQQIAGNSKQLASVKSISTIQLIYDYSDLGVGKFTKENDYVNKKVSEYNAKEAGKGDTWKSNWIGDRKKRYEPNFEALFNKYAESKITVSQNNPNADVTVIAKTTFIEPVFNVGVARKNAFIDLQLIFVETADHNKVLSTITLTNCPGRGSGGYDFDAGYRLEEAYAKAGKSSAKYLLNTLGL